MRNRSGKRLQKTIKSYQRRKILVVVAGEIVAALHAAVIGEDRDPKEGETDHMEEEMDLVGIVGVEKPAEVTVID